MVLDESQTEGDDPDEIDQDAVRAHMSSKLDKYSWLRSPVSVPEEFAGILSNEMPQSGDVTVKNEEPEENDLWDVSEKSSENGQIQ